MKPAARRLFVAAVVLFALLACLVIPLVVAQDSLRVQTDKGAVLGFQDGSGVDKWYGIPYAAPPVGDLRLAVPQPATPWPGVLSATWPGPICPQFHISFLNGFLGKEDCLYLNIWAPSNRNASTPLPVLVWIYGGGFNFGDGIEFGLYDGTNLVKKYQDFIVVTFNYRLGALGFLALPGLKLENSAGSVGGYGLYDQVAALNWVQRNIGAFVGDPNAVTIAGESAGGFSVCAHLVSPLSRGLFRGAIMESATCVSEIFFVAQDRSYDWSENYVAHLGCDPKGDDVIKCIRGLSMNAIMRPPDGYNSSWSGYIPEMFPDMSWGPTIDGVLLSDTPFRSIMRGEGAPVPVLAGTNHDEGTIFIADLQDAIPSLPSPLGPGSLEQILTHFFGQNETLIAVVEKAYPEDQFANATQQCEVMLRDFFFVCPMSRALLGLHENSGNPTWLYQFNYRGDWIEDAFLGVYHTAELEFVFNNEWPPLIHTFSPRDHAVSDMLSGYWTNFVRSGDPNGASNSTQQLYWPSYTRDTLQNIALDLPATVVEGLLESQCEMWDTIVQWSPPPPTGFADTRRSTPSMTRRSPIASLKPHVPTRHRASLEQAAIALA